MLLQIIRTALLLHNIKQRLGTEPTRHRCTNRLICKSGFLVPNLLRLLTSSSSGCVSHQLCVTALLHAHEPEYSGLDAAPDSQNTVVLQEGGLFVAEACGNVFALFFGEDYAIEAFI